jgi:hypothetical protein
MSSDKGQTWQNGKPIRAAKMLSVNVSDPDNGIPIDDTNIGQELFDVAQDPHNGYLYAVWRDGSFSGGQYSSVAFSMSTDGGFTWSAPIQVNRTPRNLLPGDQQAWLPSVKVAGDGTVAVIYYDFRNNNAKPGLPTDYWVVFGKPTTPTTLTDPANWGNELRLTDRSFDLERAIFLGNGDPVPGLFLGDYEGLKAVGNDFVATFCQAGVSQNDPKSIFFRRIQAPLAGTSAATAAGLPHLSITDVSALEGNGTTRFVFTVSLSAPLVAPVTVNLATADGTATAADGDYTPASGTLTFAPGETTKTITIEVKGDSKAEGNETFYLDLFGNIGNSWFTRSRGIGTILNDD